MLHLRETEKVLQELSAGKLPRIVVFNKIDRVYDDINIEIARKNFSEPVFVSAKTGHGLDELKYRILDEIEALKRERMYVNN